MIGVRHAATMVAMLYIACMGSHPEGPRLSSIDAKQARALLEPRFPGMSGDGSRLDPVTSLSDIEATSIREMKQCAHCPQVPFGYANKQWVAFRGGVRNGDAVTYFRNSSRMWDSLAGAEGYAL